MLYLISVKFPSGISKDKYVSSDFINLSSGWYNLSMKERVSIDIGYVIDWITMM